MHQGLFMELYKISFPPELTEKSYIGISSKGAKRRFQEHCASKKPYPIVMAINKYGREKAILTILGVFDCYDEMYKAEQKAIAQHNTKAPNGFNLTDGGKGAFGLKATDERRAKISSANKGRRATPEQRKRLSESMAGRDMSKQVAAMAEANRGRKMPEQHSQRLRGIWTGRKHSIESRMKMSESAEKRKASDSTRSKMSISMKKISGDKVFRFISPDGDRFDVVNMRQFCKENDLASGHMYNVASGKAAAHKGWRSV